MENEILKLEENKIIELFNYKDSLVAQEIELSKAKAEIEKKEILIKAEKAKLEKRVKEAMLANGIQKLEIGGRTISFRRSESINIIDESLIPAEYKKEKTTFVIDKKLIKEDIKYGCIVDGAELIENYNLQFK